MVQYQMVWWHEAGEDRRGWLCHRRTSLRVKSLHTLARPRLVLQR